MSVTQLLNNMKEVQKKYRKNILFQLLEILHLRFSKGKIGIGEYYDYKLFDDKKFTTAQKKEFVGWRMRFKLQDKLNSQYWRCLSTDKLIFQQLIASVDLPAPELQAVYIENNRNVAPYPKLESEVDLTNYLSNMARYPFFAKPVHSWHGKGGIGVSAYNNESKTLTLINNNKMKFENFYKSISNKKSGYLFQSCLQPHPDIAELTGGRLCTVRIWVLIDQNVPIIFRNYMKITAGDNMTDNNEHGESGNLICAINSETGEIYRQIKHIGFHEVLVDSHPDTGISFINFRLPLWDETKDLVSKAATMFPLLRLQPWDVAITNNGPVLVELSVPGDIDGPQFTEEYGLWDNQLTSAVAHTKPGQY